MSNKNKQITREKEAETETETKRKREGERDRVLETDTERETEREGKRGNRDRQRGKRETHTHTHTKDFVLGTTINSALSMSDHIDAKLATCASSTCIYALRTLKKHGLQPQQLHEVTRTTNLNSLLYASPAWWGFASEHDRDTSIG